MKTAALLMLLALATPVNAGVENLDEPHGTLTGDKLLVWNLYCRGHEKQVVTEDTWSGVAVWRQERCTSLDPAFAADAETSTVETVELISP